MPTFTQADALCITRRYATHSKRSGELSAALRRLPDGDDLSDQIIAADQALKQAKVAYEGHIGVIENRRNLLAAVRRTLRALCVSTIMLNEAVSDGAARSVLKGHGQDLVATAKQLVLYARELPHIGSQLARGLLAEAERTSLAETQLQEQQETLEHSVARYGDAYYRLIAACARGHAKLMASRVRLNPKKPRSQGKRASVPSGVITPRATPVSRAA